MAADRGSRIVVRIIAGAAAGLLAATGIAAASQPSSSRAKAQREAATELAALWLPAGAAKVSSDPSSGSVLGPPLVPATSRRYVIDDYGYWRVPGSPADVASRIEAHAPSGADGGFSGSPSASGVYSFG